MNDFVFIPYSAQYYEGFKQVMKLSYNDIDCPPTSRKEMALLSRLYPQGQILCLHNNVVVGAIISRVVPYHKYARPHSEAEVLDMTRYEKDHQTGDVLYCLDLFVHPDYRANQLGRKMHHLLQKQMQTDNFPCILATSRVVNYSKYKEKMPLHEYIEQVKSSSIFDPILSFHIRYKAVVMDPIPKFCKGDISSGGAAVVIKIENQQFNTTLPPAKQSRCFAY